MREGVFAGRWLFKHLRNVDYVHIHWPNFFYSRPGIVSSLYGFGLFLFLLTLARWRGARVIWTIHNLQPHDRCVVPALDRVASWVLVRVAAHFIVHGPSAEAEVVHAFPDIAGRTVVIDHGHWVGFYPDRIDRAAARARLGLGTADYVFLLIGLCKPYKNLAGLIAAFEQLSGNPVLIIAGHFPDASYLERIRAASMSSMAPDRIKLFPGYVPDDKMQVYLRACDVVVAPYLEVLTSGTGLLALSFGRPVIAPARGSLKDVINTDCGRLYPPGAAEGLCEAMRDAMGAKFDENKIHAVALTHDWHKSAKIMLQGLKG